MRKTIKILCSTFLVALISLGLSTKENIKKMLVGENGACHGKMDIAKKAKELNHDAVHDIVHEMARDEARHGHALEAMLKRYF